MKRGYMQQYYCIPGALRAAVRAGIQRCGSLSFAEHGSTRLPRVIFIDSNTW